MKIPRFMLRTVVTLEPYAGSSAVGPVFGPACQLRGHFEKSTRLVSTGQRREIVASAVFYVDTNESIPEESKVTHAGVEYRVVRVVDNGTGFSSFVPRHRELYLSPSRETGESTRG